MGGSPQESVSVSGQALVRPVRLGNGCAIVAAVAAATLVFHLATAGVYGLFIDELYFLACGEHLAWGYVDMPPLTAVQAWLARSLFGDSMLAIRLLPALACAGLVLLTGALVRELGGKRFAQGLAALSVALAPAYLFVGSYLSMNSIEPLVWMGCALVLIRIIKTGNTKLWLAFGVLAGIGLENKDTVLLFGFALVCGLLLTAERRLMANRWFLLGGLVAFLIFLPNLAWVIQHHFPHVELLANIRRDQRNVELSAFQFIAQQAIFLGPLVTPVWLAGLWHLLARREGRLYRALALAYLTTIGVLLVVHGRVYYPLPAYPMLFAAGATALEYVLTWPRWSWVKPSYVALVALSGAALAPLAAPILPPEAYLRYTRAIHLEQPRIEHRLTSALPQLFADRFGWPEMAETVARVYHALPPEDQARCAIFGNDYGQAGAIDFYGPRLGLPKAISGHLNYWYWGPRDYTGDCLIVLGDTRAGVERWFSDVKPVAEVGHLYAMRQEHFTVFLCRKPKGFETLQQAWPQLKRWN
ncbi:MAG TPA: glycosyltransferase family 39 protein [Thermoanaerobaculaceae bacterium]|nr:glycosyltransferase family 39 protein [Thermoanaerobaculaceae bacterium]